MTILEGMATGTPIIASNIGGLRYIIHDRVNGLLFTTGDEKDLAQKMQWLLENSAKAHEFGVKGREQVEDQYSEDSYYKQLLDLFAKVIA